MCLISTGVYFNSNLYIFYECTLSKLFINTFTLCIICTQICIFLCSGNHLVKSVYFAYLHLCTVISVKFVYFCVFFSNM